MHRRDEIEFDLYTLRGKTEVKIVFITEPLKGLNYLYSKLQMVYFFHDFSLKLQLA